MVSLTNKPNQDLILLVQTVLVQIVNNNAIPAMNLDMCLLGAQTVLGLEEVAMGLVVLAEEVLIEVRMKVILNKKVSKEIFTRVHMSPQVQFNLNNSNSR